MEPTEVIIDYAYPCMMAEKALRITHDAMLRGDFDTALNALTQVMVEAKIAINSVKEMKGKTSDRSEEGA
jgi:hypothetical protein